MEHEQVRTREIQVPEEANFVERSFVTSLLLVRMSPNTVCVRASALVLAVVTCPFVFEGLEGELWRLGSHPTSDTKLMCFIHVLLNKQ